MKLKDYSICLGEAADLEELSILYDKVAEYCETTVNYPCWIKGVYPAKATALKGIEKKELFVLKTEGKIAGTVILNDVQDKSYSELNWNVEAKGKEVLVIHTLAIHPDFFNCGIASILINFIEEFAQKNLVKTIRFDTHTNNIPAINLYTKKGYKMVGEVSLDIEYDIPNLFKCFDKKIG